MTTKTTKTSTSVYQIQGEGWYCKDRLTKAVYGPFRKREEARQQLRDINVRNMDERAPTKLHVATAH